MQFEIWSSASNTLDNICQIQALLQLSVEIWNFIICRDVYVRAKYHKLTIYDHIFKITE